MRAKLATALIGSLIACQANAASWYGLISIGKASAFFFDFDTVKKEKGDVTIWVKTVRITPDEDGAYSSASKRIYYCSKRTVMFLTTVEYDKDEKLMRTLRNPSTSDIVPGTIGEMQFNTFCAPDFPSRKSNSYFAVGDNDIYAATKRILEPDDPAPK